MIVLSKTVCVVFTALTKVCRQTQVLFHYPFRMTPCRCWICSVKALILTTSLQLDNMENRKGWRPPPNPSPLNTPLDPWQDSRAPALLFQLCFSRTCTHARLVPPCWAPLSLCSSIGTHFDKKEGLHTTPSTHFL